MTVRAVRAVRADSLLYKTSVMVVLVTDVSHESVALPLVKTHKGRWTENVSRERRG